MEADIYITWTDLVKKHTRGGACNFQGAAIELATLIKTKEREACAKICDEQAKQWKDSSEFESIAGSVIVMASSEMAASLANQIRARGGA